MRLGTLTPTAVFLKRSQSERGSIPLGSTNHLTLYRVFLRLEKLSPVNLKQAVIFHDVEDAFLVFDAVTWGAGMVVSNGLFDIAGFDEVVF